MSSYHTSHRCSHRTVHLNLLNLLTVSLFAAAQIEKSNTLSPTRSSQTSVRDARPPIYTVGPTYGSPPGPDRPMSRPGSRPRSKCILIAARLSYFYLFDRHLIFILIAAVGPCRRAQEGERSLACGVGLSFGAQNASPPMSHHMSSSEHTASSRARTQRALCSDQSGHAGGRITRGEALICTLSPPTSATQEGRKEGIYLDTHTQGPKRQVGAAL